MSLATVRRTGAVAALALTGLAGCLDATGVDDHEEPDIAAVMLSAGLESAASGSVTVGEDGQSGVLTLRANTANALTVRVLDAERNDEPAVMQHSDEFEIRLEGDLPVSSTIDGGYPYRFTVTPLSSPGTYQYRVVVFSIEHDHAEAEFPVQITVAPAQ